MSKSTQWIPRIAVTCDVESITTKRGQVMSRFVLGHAYVEAIAQAGGMALAVPQQIVDITQALASMDGLLITGGDFDIPPEMYGQTRRPCCRATRGDRSHFEAQLLAEALRRDMPVLGVCGGMQLLCVQAGGSLHQDLSERPGTTNHEQAHSTFEPAHRVTLAAGCALCPSADAQTIEVNSTHHQLISSLGQNVVSIGLAPDGVIEAIAYTAAHFVVGVQWHPELLDAAAQTPYRALLAHCRQR